MAQAFLPLLGMDASLQGKPGCIVNMSSIYGSYALPFSVPRSAAMLTGVLFTLWYCAASACFTCAAAANHHGLHSKAAHTRSLHSPSTVCVLLLLTGRAAHTGPLQR